MDRVEESPLLKSELWMSLVYMGAPYLFVLLAVLIALSAPMRHRYAKAALVLGLGVASYALLDTARPGTVPTLLLAVALFGSTMLTKPPAARNEEETPG